MLKFSKEVVGELRKTVWPSLAAMRYYLTVTFLFVILTVAGLAGLNYVGTQAALKLFGG